jgi:hypothetical protein
VRVSIFPFALTSASASTGRPGLPVDAPGAGVDFAALMACIRQVRLAPALREASHTLPNPVFGKHFANQRLEIYRQSKALAPNRKSGAREKKVTPPAI